MKNAIHLDHDVMQNDEDFVYGLLKRFDTLIRSTNGVLSGMMIWRKFYHGLGINIEKEILDAFGINDLEDKIYGIKSVVLYNDPSTNETFLLFNVDNGNEEKVSARDVAEGLFISSRAVSGAMRKLVSDGYIEKMGQDPVIYSLTEKGKNIKIED